MNKKSPTFFYFILGAAAGAAIGFYLASDNKKELIEDIKNAAGKIREELEDEIDLGKQLVEEIRSMASEFLKNL